MWHLVEHDVLGHRALRRGLVLLGVTTTGQVAHIDDVGIGITLLATFLSAQHGTVKALCLAIAAGEADAEDIAPDFAGAATGAGPRCPPLRVVVAADATVEDRRCSKPRWHWTNLECDYLLVPRE